MEFRDNHGDVSCRIDFPQGISFIRTSPEIALPVEAKSIRSAAWLHVSRDFPIGAPFEDPVVWLIGEEHIPSRIASGSFGE